MATLPLTIVILLDDNEVEEMTEMRRTYCRRAAEDHPGPFGPIEIVEHPCGRPLGLPLTPENGWLFLLRPGDVPLPFLLEQSAVALSAYDAIWGAHVALSEDDAQITPIPETALGCTTLEKLVFRNPDHWLLGSYFMRRATAVSMRSGEANDVTDLLALWGDGRCTKLALPFIVPHETKAAHDFDRILAYFRNNPVITKLNVDGEELAFRIAYWNPIIESYLADGGLFEAAQLRALRKHLEPGATIVDVGANIGQHLVYFARIAKAGRVIPIEPNPDFVEILKENIALNDLDNVDTSLLGIGVGASAGKCRIAAPDDNPQNLTVDYDTDGEIPVMPLDDVVTGPIDLIKIDVDESEIEVLQGMTRILTEVRPILATEVVHPNLEAFMEILDRFDYQVDHLFPNPQYNDIVAVPKPAA